MEGVTEASPWCYLENWYCVTPLPLSVILSSTPTEESCQRKQNKWVDWYSFKFIVNEQSGLSGNSTVEFPGGLLHSMRFDCCHSISLTTFLPVCSLSLGPFCILCIAFPVTAETSTSLLSFFPWCETRLTNLLFAFCLLFPSQELHSPFYIPSFPADLPLTAGSYSLAQKNSACKAYLASNTLLVRSKCSAGWLHIRFLRFWFTYFSLTNNSDNVGERCLLTAPVWLEYFFLPFTLIR